MVQKKDKRKYNGGHSAGRKEYEDKTMLKKPVTAYIRAYEIELIGGIEAARGVALTALTKEIAKRIKK